LSGKKESPWTEKGSGEYRYAEASYGSFSRAFELPRNVAGDAIRAEYANGVLTLRIPKAKEALSKVIEIG
jgi:HSP20 family protein